VRHALISVRPKPIRACLWVEVEAALAAAIRSSGGGQMTRNAEVFLARVCAKHLSGPLALAGFVVVRRVE